MSTVPASARPASPSSIRAATNGSSRPTSSSSRPTRSSTSSSCCCRGSASPTTRSPTQGVIGRNFTHQTISDVIGFFDKDEIQLQSVHRLRLDRHVHRRIQRRQFRSRSARLRRRRIHGAGADQRAPDSNDARSAGHAALGREMEERGARQLSEHGDAGNRRARQLLQLIATSISTSTRSIATDSAVRWCGSRSTFTTTR